MPKGISNVYLSLEIKSYITIQLVSTSLLQDTDTEISKQLNVQGCIFLLCTRSTSNAGSTDEQNINTLLFTTENMCNANQKIHKNVFPKTDAKIKNRYAV